MRKGLSFVKKYIRPEFEEKLLVSESVLGAPVSSLLEKYGISGTNGITSYAVTSNALIVPYDETAQSVELEVE